MQSMTCAAEPGTPRPTDGRRGPLRRRPRAHGRDRAPRSIGRRRALLLWLTLVAGCGGGAETPDPPAAPLVAPGTWVVLGSSTAAGIGAPAGDGWASLLAAQVQPLGVRVVNLARPGLTSRQALPTATERPAGTPAPDPAVNIDRALVERPRLVLIAFPSNDAVAGIPAADTVAAWRLMQSRAQSAGAATLVLSTQPRAALTLAQQAALVATDAAAAAHFGPCFVPLREALAGPEGGPAPTYSAGDGVHLSAVGHRLVLDRVAAALAAGACVRLSDGP